MNTSPGQRMLAAIVFTDTVGFSQLVGRDEEGTLALVKKDLELMTHLCERFDGRVVKSTGDGLMMIFSSAVQAVNCSLEIQRILTEQARRDRHALRHRIGVHLGDVIVSDDDALGDGVNVAARLEQESEPGGICMSQVVYDVVKGRMFLEAAKIGELRLKNIAEPIGAYKVAGVAKARKHKKVRKLSPYVALFACGLVLAAVGGVLTARIVSGGSAKPVAARTSAAIAGPQSRVDSVQGQLPTLKYSDSPQPDSDNPPAVTPGPDAPAPAPQNGQIAGSSTAEGVPPPDSDFQQADDEAPPATAAPQNSAQPTPSQVGQTAATAPTPFQAAWKQYARKYDYENMATWVRDHPDQVPVSTAQSLRTRYESLANLIDWTKGALAKTSVQAPLQIGWKGNPGKVWQQPDGRLVIVLPNNRYLRKMSVLGPILIASIIRGLIATSQVDATTRDTLYSGVQALVADADEHKGS